MWKIMLGFVVFAAAVLFVLNKSGGDIDIGGEKHGVEAPHAAEPAKVASPGASAVTPEAAAAVKAAAAAATSAATSASAASATK